MHAILYKTHRNTIVHKETCFSRGHLGLHEDFGSGDNHSLTDALSAGSLNVGSICIDTYAPLHQLQK